MWLTDGGYSRMQYDNVALRAKAAQIAKALPEIMAATGAEGVAVRGKSGVSMMFAVLMLVDVPVIVLRKRGESSHGASVEGTEGVNITKYLILDDFISTGATVDGMIRDAESYAGMQDNTNDGKVECVGIIEYNHNYHGSLVPTSMYEGIITYRIAKD